MHLLVCVLHRVKIKPQLMLSHERDHFNKSLVFMVGLESTPKATNSLASSTFEIISSVYSWIWQAIRRPASRHKVISFAVSVLYYCADIHVVMMIMMTMTRTGAQPSSQCPPGVDSKGGQNNTNNNPTTNTPKRRV